MKSETYKQIRMAYYTGIFLLVLYALPAIPIVSEFLIPLLNIQILGEVSLINLVAIMTGVGAFAAFKYRKIG